MSSRNRGSKKDSASLNELIARYRERHLNQPDSWAEYTAAHSDTGDQAKVAASARNADGKKHPHQWRLRSESLDSFGERIADRKDRINAVTTFDEIHDIVREARVPGVGDLAIYDTTYRLCARRKIEPDKVYLHSGVLEGAKKYGLVSKWRPFLLQDELPKEFKGLTPHQVEAFLCIYKDGRLHL